MLNGKYAVVEDAMEEAVEKGETVAKTRNMGRPSIQSMLLGGKLLLTPQLLWFSVSVMKEGPIYYPQPPSFGVPLVPQ